jgi:hypothetical protein
VRASITTIGVHHIHGLRHETCARKVSTVAVTVAGSRRIQSQHAAMRAAASGGHT